MADAIQLMQFTVLFAALFWSILFLMPLRAAHYASDGRLVVRRIWLGNLFHALVARRLSRKGSNLVLDLAGESAIVGGARASASLVGLLVVPWVG